MRIWMYTGLTEFMYGSQPTRKRFCELRNRAGNVERMGLVKRVIPDQFNVLGTYNLTRLDNLPNEGSRNVLKNLIRTKY